MIRRRLTAVLGAAALSVPLFIVASATADAGSSGPGDDAADLAGELVESANADSAKGTLEKLQEIADANGGNRAAGGPGYDASAEYVYNELEKAGYDVSYDDFDFTYFESQTEEMSVVSPEARDVEVLALTYSPSTPEGGIEAPLAATPVDADGTSGCEAEDFAGGDFEGKVALIQRGECTFAQKQTNAADAGAVAVLVYNNVEGPVNGTLEDPANAVIPSGGITLAEGEALAGLLDQGEVTVNLDLQTLTEERSTRNVIAETPGGDAANTVMFGAHLDSVPEGPGINDNASGAGGMLEVAKQLAKAEDDPRNKIRFAWWSAEELGTVGSADYVSRLSEEQRSQIRAYLNFDMIASPNYGVFVYDGDDSDADGEGAGPEGSAQLEKQITDFLDEQGVPHEGTDLSGRSDYAPFVEAGIPSGGGNTGVDAIKTEEQAAKWGGEAGIAFDPCYHTDCDDLDNVNMTAFNHGIDIIANAVGTYAHDLSALGQEVASAPADEGDAGNGGVRTDHHHHGVAK